MPVQINEVVVRTTVDPKALCPPASGEGRDKEGADNADSEVIERVLEIIREMKER